MKILAATPVRYGRTRYIVELDSDELTALVTFEPYGQVPIEGNAEGRAKDDLRSGDIIPPEHARDSLNKVQIVLNSKKNIDDSGRAAVMAIEKLQDIFADMFPRPTQPAENTP